MTVDDQSVVEVYTPRVWPGTYALPPARLVVSEEALAATLASFRPFAAERLEAVCFWYGPRDDVGSGSVTAVVVPPQRNYRRRYHVPSEAMAAVARATGPRGWRNLCQVHTHPGDLVEHSFYDDEHANSRRALSIVLPRYGASDRWPHHAVHEFQNGQWHLLGRDVAAARIVRGGPSACEVLDLR